MRYVIALVGSLWICILGLPWIGELAGWNPIGSGLLPFDAPVTNEEFVGASLALAGLLCALRLLGATRWRWYLAAGLAASLAPAIAAAAARVGGALLPFWTVSALIGAIVATLAWLLLRWPFRPRPWWIHGFGVMLAAPLAFYTSVLLGLGLLLSNDEFVASSSFAIPGGGRVSSYEWYSGGFQDDYLGNAALFTPPGWWTRAERIAELPWDDHLTAVRWFANGTHDAVALETSGGGVAAKRIMQTGVPTRWEQPRIEFPCLWRGFEPPESRPRERLVATEVFGPSEEAPDELLVDVEAGVRRCERPGTWRPTNVDLRANVLQEDAHELPPNALRTAVYASERFDEPWVLDLRRTLAANPESRPIPLPDATAEVTVIEVALPPAQPGETDVEAGLRRSHAILDLPRRPEELLALDRTRIVCREQTALRAGVAAELWCRDPALEGPRFIVMGLWGDPNPALVAISVNSSWHSPPSEVYLLVPLGWNVPISNTSPHRDASFLRAFVRIERRQGRGE